MYDNMKVIVHLFSYLDIKTHSGMF